jgi:hypothetical protein
MERAFSHYFPDGLFSPTHVANKDHMHTAVIRLRRLGYKNGHVIQESCSIVTSNVSNHNPTSGDAVSTAVIVPAGKRADIVRQSPYVVLATLHGPSRTVFAGPSMFTQSVFVNTNTASPHFVSWLDSTLVALQKRLCVRLYAEPGFCGSSVDVPVGYTIKLLRLMEYRSMLIPYGLAVDRTNRVEDALPATLSHKQERDGTPPRLGAAMLRGPMIVSDLSLEHAYFGALVLADVCAKTYVRDYTDSEHSMITMAPFTNAGNLTRVHSVTVRLTSDMYEKLKPLTGYYLLSQCLGQGTTVYMAATVPWQLDDDIVTRLVLFWLKKFQGDYSIITPFLNGAPPKFLPAVRRAVSRYFKLANN